MPGSMSRGEMFSSIIPIETFVGRRPRISTAVMFPGFGVREHARLVDDQPAHGLDVLNSRAVPSVGEKGSGLGPLRFGAIAQRQQGLSAPVGVAGHRDRQDILRR